MEKDNSFRMHLYRKTLPLLAGYKLALVLSKPQKSRGEFANNHVGDVAIYIDPNLDPEQFFKVFLHECGHAAGRHIQNNFDKESAEREAEKWCIKWIDISEPNVYIPGRDIETRLLTLINYFKTPSK